jgi:hypothetical protein
MKSLTIVIIIFMLALIIGGILIYIKSSIAKTIVVNDGMVGSIPIPLITPVPTSNPLITPVPTSNPLITPVPTNNPLITPVPTSNPLITPAPTSNPLITPVPTSNPLITPVPTSNPVITPVAITNPVIYDSSIPNGYYLQKDGSNYVLHNYTTKIKNGLGQGCIKALTGPFAFLSKAGATEEGTVSCSVSATPGDLNIYTCVDNNGTPMSDCCGDYEQSDTGATRRLLTAYQAKNSNRTTVVNTSGAMMSCDEPTLVPELAPVQQDYTCMSNKKCVGSPRPTSGALTNSFPPLISDNGGLGTEGEYSGPADEDPCGGICDLTKTTMRTYYASRNGDASLGYIPSDKKDYNPWNIAGDVKVCDLIKNNSGCNTVIDPVLSDLGTDKNELITDCFMRNGIFGSTATSCNFRGDNDHPPFVCNMIGLTGVPGTVMTTYGVPRNYNNWGGKGWCNGTVDHGKVIHVQNDHSNKDTYSFTDMDLGCSVKAELTAKNPGACG